jgi:hypothetical protein
MSRVPHCHASNMDTECNEHAILLPTVERECQYPVLALMCRFRVEKYINIRIAGTTISYWRYDCSWHGTISIHGGYGLVSNLVTTVNISLGHHTTPARSHICDIPVIHYRWQLLLLPSRLLRLPLLEPLLHLGATALMSADSLSRTLVAHLFSFPTFTVAIILTSGPGKLSAKQVNSKKLECSEYGTPTLVSVVA